MTPYFITGIDTGCGKTFVTGTLGRILMDTGLRVITQKLAQTGCSGISEDIIEHRRLMSCSLFPEDESGLTCPYVFSYPASPHLAAKLDNTLIDPQIITEATLKLAGNYDVVLVEGAGGLHVPLSDDLLILEYIKKQHYPVILVTSPVLGSINHTLLSIDSCFMHGLDLCALLFNRLPGTDAVIADDSLKIMTQRLRARFPDSMVEEVGSGFPLLVSKITNINNNN